MIPTGLFLRSYGVKFAAPNSNFIDIPFKTDLTQLKHAPGFISKRIHFDNFLVQQIDRQYAKPLIEESRHYRYSIYTDSGVEYNL